MVGDSITDIRTARAASVPVIAVDFGYTDVPITTLGPDRIISSFAELPEAIVSLVEAVSACRTQCATVHAPLRYSCTWGRTPCLRGDILVKLSNNDGPPGMGGDG
jgi:hypothetical protein